MGLSQPCSSFGDNFGPQGVQMRKTLYTLILLVLPLSGVNAEIHAKTKGKCEVDYLVKDGLWSLGIFDETALKRADTPQKCAVVSASSAFNHKRVLKFTFGKRAIPIANGLINPYLN